MSHKTNYVKLTWISRKSLSIERLPAIQFNVNDDDILPSVPRPNLVPRDTSAQDRVTSKLNITELVPQDEHRWWNDNRSIMPQENARDFEDGEDVMDWEPVGRSGITALYPQQRSEPPEPLHLASLSGQSPFRGSIPRAPVAPAWKLRNPAAYNPSAFRKPPEIATLPVNPFSETAASHRHVADLRRRERGNHSQSDDSADDLSEGTNDDAASTARAHDTYSPASDARNLRSRTKGRDMEIQPPKFFAPQDLHQVTGLEDAFGARSFGIQESPLGERRARGWGWRSGR